MLSSRRALQISGTLVASFETVEIVEELVEIWPNEVCDREFDVQRWYQFKTIDYVVAVEFYAANKFMM